MLIKLVTDDGSTHAVETELEQFKDILKFGTGNDYVSTKDGWFINTTKIIMYKVENSNE